MRALFSTRHAAALALCLASLASVSTALAADGTLVGAIYEKGNSANRVSGAVVTVGGKSITTGSDGFYEAVLAPGTYTAKVTKSGYGSATVTRTVASGLTVWGSMEINVVAASGILRGRIYEHPNLDAGLAGATVTCGAKTATSDSGGNYSFTMAPGTYTVKAVKTGYATNSLTRTVVASTTVWGSVPLSPTGSVDTQPPSLDLDAPLDASVVDLGSIDVNGTVSDNGGAISQVMVALNGGAAAVTPVTAGTFSLEVRLKAGVNTVAVSAKDAAGNAKTVSAKVTLKVGLSGVVYENIIEHRPVVGAVIELRSAEGATVAKTTAQDDGSFVLDAPTAPATFTLAVHHQGYLLYTKPVAISDEQRLRLQIPLTPTQISGEPGISFVEPLNGAKVNVAEVVVFGRVSGMDLARVQVNGIDGEILGSDGFAATVPLSLGTNTLQAIATGKGAETFTASITVNRVPRVNHVAELPDEPRSGGCGSVPGALESGWVLWVGAWLSRRRQASRRLG
jgi:hypothetical protein